VKSPEWPIAFWEDDQLRISGKCKKNNGLKEIKMDLREEGKSFI
jgi:hypothetical protein